MSQPATLRDFNPFGVHPFTDGNGVQSYPQPSQYPLPLPSSTAQYTSGTPAHMLPQRQLSTSNVIYSPEPRRPIPLVNQQSTNAAHQRHQKPIFTTFQQDRSSPELEEILLRKKLTQTLGPVALGKQGSYPSS